MDDRGNSTIDKLNEIKRWLEDLRQEIVDDIEFRVRKKFTLDNDNLPYQPDFEKREAAIRYYIELTNMRLKDFVEIEERVRALDWIKENLEVGGKDVQTGKS